VGFEIIGVMGYCMFLLEFCFWIDTEVFCFEKKLVGLLLLNFAVSLFYF
jgi:hypothetical protein